MIESLDDAWEWYTAVRTLALDMKRLAGIRDDPVVDTLFSKRSRLRDRSSAELTDRAEKILEDLDHLAVLLLFSVFEATVRARATADVDRETATMRHPAVLTAITNLKESIENGSFGKVTEAYRSMDVDLTTQVNQVRKFRNWVAHGRRGRAENNVIPEDAHERLQRYLARLSEIEKAATITAAPDIPLPENLSESE